MSTQTIEELDAEMTRRIKYQNGRMDMIYDIAKMDIRELRTSIQILRWWLVGTLIVAVTALALVTHLSGATP